MTLPATAQPAKASKGGALGTRQLVTLLYAFARLRLHCAPLFELTAAAAVDSATGMQRATLVPWLWGLSRVAQLGPLQAKALGDALLPHVHYMPVRGYCIVLTAPLCPA